MAALASRLSKELKRLARAPPPGVAAWPAGGAALSRLDVSLQGPPDSPYEAGLFRLTVIVPERYPFEPPKVQFVTPVYHPNIDAQGRICLDFLNMPPKGCWGPALDLYKVLVAVRQLLAEPNPKDPLVADIADECVSAPEVFAAKARAHVARHAAPGAAAALSAQERSGDGGGGGRASSSAAQLQPAPPGAGGDGKENAAPAAIEGTQQEKQQEKQQQQQQLEERRRPPAAAAARAPAQGGGAGSWAEDELRAFYAAHHACGGDASQVAAALGGARGAAECAALAAQFHTFLGLPAAPGRDEQFVGLVRDVQAERGGRAAGEQQGDSEDDEPARTRQQAEQQAQEAERQALHEQSGSQQQAEPAEEADGQPQQQAAAAAQAHRQRMTSLAQRLAVELGGLGSAAPSAGGSAATSQGALDTEADEVDAAGGGGGGSQGGPARPQRVRKPKQYLGEPVTTPRGGGARGSLPATPSSSTRRKGARGGARRRGGAAHAAADGGSARRRRPRRLFGDAGAAYADGGAYEGGGYDEGGLPYPPPWADDGGEGEDEPLDDDVEEGVDALLSLASMAHASSSAATGSGAAGDDGGAPHRGRRAGGRRGARGWDGAGDGAGSGGELRGGGGGGYHGGSQGGGYSGLLEGDDDAEDAAGGLAQMRTGSQGWGTPKRAESLFYTTGTPGGVGRKGLEFVLASPALSDRPHGLPSPGGRRRGSTGPRSPAGRSRSGARKAGAKSRSGARRPGGGGGGGGGRAGGARAAPRDSGGSSGRAAAAPLYGELGSEEGEGSEDGHGLMDAAELAAAVSAGPGLSSPNLRTTSANEPPRSALLLGKRAGGGDDADTPASHRSVRQRVDGAGMVAHLIPQPLFAAGGAGAAAAGDLLPGALDGAADGEAAPPPALPSPAGRKRGREEEEEQPPPPGRGTRSGRAKRAKQQQAPRNQRKPRNGGRLAIARGVRVRRRALGPHCPPAAARFRPTRPPRPPAAPSRHPRRRHRCRQGLDAPPAEGAVLPGAEWALRHMLAGRARRWVQYEFHCSAIDRPYFMRSEMHVRSRAAPRAGRARVGRARVGRAAKSLARAAAVAAAQDLLEGLGLGGVTALTRCEWSVLRGAAGRPRRLSLAFLKQERVRLEQYRERVRAAYEVSGVGNEVPPDMPRPLRVGQGVVARHPATRSLHDGIILTIKPRQYRVQFNRTELLSEVVRDVDVMPLDPSESLPAAVAHSAHATRHVPLLNGRPTAAGAAALSAGGLLRRRPAAAAAPARAEAARQADQQLLAELSAVLSRKEALLAQLRSISGEAEAAPAADGAAHAVLQARYGAAYAQVQAANAELAQLMPRLHARPHLGVVAAPLPREAGGGARGAGAADAGGAPPAGPAAAAAALVAAAGAEAHALVARARTKQAAQQQQQPAAADADAAAAAAAPLAAPSAAAAAADGLVASCLALLVALQKATAPPRPGEAPLGAAGVEATLDGALAQLRPASAAGRTALAEVAAQVGQLKALLARAH
ncbi:UBE2T [Scenedesmus sp. PABB004]|nr:UBE2T [Scenedesmus sp. PABB004]